MKFLQETGAIINPQNQILRLVDGNFVSVEFNPEIIWTFHKQSPGSVFAFCHTHPIGMDTLSRTDLIMFKGWGWALYPWPVRMFLITIKNGNFVKNSWLGQLESKEEWIKRGKRGERNFQIIKEEKNELGYDCLSWENILLDRSYKY